MDDVNKFIYHFLSVTLFAIAVAFTFNLARTYNSLVYGLEQTQVDDPMYQDVTGNIDIISYGELIAILSNQLEHNIRIIDEKNVNELIISKFSHDASKIDGYNVPETDYRRTYDYDKNGNISGVIYTSVDQ